MFTIKDPLCVKQDNKSLLSMLKGIGQVVLALNKRLVDEGIYCEQEGE